MQVRENMQKMILIYEKFDVDNKFDFCSLPINRNINLSITMNSHTAKFILNTSSYFFITQLLLIVTLN